MEKDPGRRKSIKAQGGKQPDISESDGAMVVEAHSKREKYS